MYDYSSLNSTRITLSSEIKKSKTLDDFEKYLKEEYGIETQDESIYTLIEGNQDAFKSFIEDTYNVDINDSLNSLMDMEYVNGQFYTQEEIQQLEENNNLKTVSQNEDNTVTLSAKDLGYEINDGKATIEDENGNISEFEVDNQGNFEVELDSEGSLNLPTKDGNSQYFADENGNFNLFFDTNGNLTNKDNVTFNLSNQNDVNAFINEFINDPVVSIMIDTDGNSEISKEEISAFLEIINQSDGDSNLTYDDIAAGIVAAHKVQDIQNQVEKSGVDLEKEPHAPTSDAIQSNIDAYNSAKSSSGGSSSSGSTSSGSTSSSSSSSSSVNQNMTLEELQAQKTQVQSEIDNLTSQANEFDGDISTKEGEYETAKEDYQKEVEKEAENNEELAQIQDEINQNLEAITNLEATKSETQTNIITTQTNISTLSSQLSAKNGQIADLKSQIAKLALSEDSENSSEKANLESQLATAQQEAQNLAQQKQEQENALKTLQTTLLETTTKLNEENEKKAKLDEAVLKVAQESQNEDLKKALEDMNSAKNAVDEAKKQKEDIQNKTIQKQSEMSKIDSLILEKTQAQADKEYSNDALLQYNEEYGQNIANAAASLYPNSGYGGYCAAGVTNSLRKATGIQQIGTDAWLYVDKMNQRDDFVEYDNFDYDNMSQAEVTQMINDLPAGTVIIWGKNPKNQYGHIAILDGKGNEISDGTNKIWTEYKNRGSDLHVYIPTG